GFASMKRREFLGVLGGAVAAGTGAVRAQQEGANVPKIGVLWPGITAPASPRMESFRRGLREQGYVDGRNVSVQLRYPREGLEALPSLAAELVRSHVDVLSTFGDLGPNVARQATQTIPIVVISDDMVGAGLIANLSRPGGNITGLTILSPELSAKRLEV